MIGPGKPIDTDRFFVICANVIGGCMGSTGPAEIDPATGKPYGLDFPLVTIARHGARAGDAARCAGHREILCVIGGSMGGMQVLQWAASYPDRVRRRRADRDCAARHSAQNIAFHEVGRQAIMADPDWKGGDYQLHGTRPSKGLAVARMAAHITYLSEAALQRKFGRSLQNREALSFGFGSGFPDRKLSASPGHDASSTASTPIPISTSPARWIISIWRPTMAARWRKPFAARRTRFCIISFTSDWLFPTAENKRIAHALNAVAANVSFVEIETDKRPRCLPAGRAGNVRDRARLSQFARPPAAASHEGAGAGAAPRSRGDRRK